MCTYTSAPNLYAGRPSCGEAAREWAARRTSGGIAWRCGDGDGGATRVGFHSNLKQQEGLRDLNLDQPPALYVAIMRMPLRVLGVATQAHGYPAHRAQR
jgi:hypothetical protein